MASVIAFDVNETLLDLAALDAPFEERLGDAALRPQWFAQMLQLAFVGGLTGQYVDFTAAQRAALVMVSEREGVPLSADDIDSLVALMSSLPPHPEVPGALASLALTDLYLVALTNSVQAVAEAQLASAGLDGYFDAIMSADEVAHLKPAPQPYLAHRLAHPPRNGESLRRLRGRSARSRPAAPDARPSHRTHVRPSRRNGGNSPRKSRIVDFRMIPADTSIAVSFALCKHYNDDNILAYTISTMAARASSRGTLQCCGQ